MKYIFSFLLFAFHTFFAFSNNNWHNLKFGNYAIGFKETEIKNSSNATMKISIWYPSNSSSIPNLKLQDYLIKAGVEKKELQTFLNDALNGLAYNFSKDTLNWLLQLPFKATVNAKQLNQKFPLLIWSPRHGTIYYQSLINEYLASHGYVVICAERIKEQLPFFWDIKDSLQKEKTVDARLDDLESMYQFAKKQNIVNSKKISLLAWSYGGEVAQIFSQSHPELKLVCGLSAIDYSKKGYSCDIQARINPKKLTIPNFLIYEKENNRNIKYDNNILKQEMLAHSKVITMPTIKHGNFNFIEGMCIGFLQTNNCQPWVQGGIAAKDGYEKIANILLKTLNNYLK